LIHAAVGLYHQRRGNLIGARSQISKAIQKLGRGPAEVHGIRVPEFIAQLANILDGLEGTRKT
jgi:predicted metal-dependent hydrolase